MGWGLIFTRGLAPGAFSKSLYENWRSQVSVFGAIRWLYIKLLGDSPPDLLFRGPKRKLGSRVLFRSKFEKLASPMPNPISTRGLAPWPFFSESSEQFKGPECQFLVQLLKNKKNTRGLTPKPPSQVPN